MVSAQLVGVSLIDYFGNRIPITDLEGDIEYQELAKDDTSPMAPFGITPFGDIVNKPGASIASGKYAAAMLEALYSLRTDLDLIRNYQEIYYAVHEAPLEIAAVKDKTYRLYSNGKLVGNLTSSELAAEYQKLSRNNRSLMKKHFTRLK
ncbi:hypothetical protein [Allohahella sp. A8]|jgi:hypothetical protein|uniref:hypothetical protein n=1 Tax=Allohahella sp. A8 TaxID=3141461 RepID=UPI000C0ADDDE|nr:hypothetical protein [Hahellaceae bacterium]|tara:strand:- start:32989 stop:33435 length:447 start_codon:yes stop_codon:yes gene_type:complete